MCYVLLRPLTYMYMYMYMTYQYSLVHCPIGYAKVTILLTLVREQLRAGVKLGF